MVTRAHSIRLQCDPKRILSLDMCPLSLSFSVPTWRDQNVHPRMWPAQCAVTVVMPPIAPNTPWLPRCGVPEAWLGGRLGLQKSPGCGPELGPLSSYDPKSSRPFRKKCSASHQSAQLQLSREAAEGSFLACSPAARQALQGWRLQNKHLPSPTSSTQTEAGVGHLRWGCAWTTGPALFLLGIPISAVSGKLSSPHSPVPMYASPTAALSTLWHK